MFSFFFYLKLSKGYSQNLLCIISIFSNAGMIKNALDKI